jgi:predicted amidohydrolase
MKFKVALAQIDTRLGDIDANLRIHLSSIADAKKQGAQMVVFPELSLTGYTLRDLTWDVALNPFTDPRLQPLREASRSISIVVGFVESADDHGFYNSAMLLEDGLIRHIHRKIYPPTYGMFEEGRYFSQGHDVAAFDSKLGRFGILICEDLWHMSLPYILAIDGAEAIITPTASPSRIGAGPGEMGSVTVNQEHHKAYARLLSSYIVFSNRVGYEDGVNFWGGSSVTNPSGVTIVSGQLFHEELVLAEIDDLEVSRARRFSRHFLDEDLGLVQSSLERIRGARGLRTSESSPK